MIDVFQELEEKGYDKYLSMFSFIKGARETFINKHYNETPDISDDIWALVIRAKTDPLSVTVWAQYWFK